jgi:hypothetical protein
MAIIKQLSAINFACLGAAFHPEWEIANHPLFGAADVGVCLCERYKITSYFTKDSLIGYHQMFNGALIIGG